MNSAIAVKAAHLVLIVRPPSRLEIAGHDAQTHLRIVGTGIDDAGAEKVRQRDQRMCCRRAAEMA
jgi:hypothetical protein